MAKHHRNTYIKRAYKKGKPMFQKMVEGRKRCNGKFIYAEKEASETADKIFFYEGKLLRTYKCKGNDHWHLTSKVGRGA